MIDYSEPPRTARTWRETSLLAKLTTNSQAFEHAITQVVEIAKQNEGWLKSQLQGQGHGQSRRAMPAGSAAPGAP
ncbi:MAG: hypothetical protein ACT4QB_07630 [Gammaproteobacteria bacterium]